MSNKLVTIKTATANVTASGIKVTGEATTAASERLTALMAHNNGKDLREDEQKQKDRGAALANIHALLSVAVQPLSLAEARSAFYSGALAHVVAPRALFTKGSSASAVNMSLDRDAKAFGFGEEMTARAFNLDDDTVVIYCGQPK